MPRVWVVLAEVVDMVMEEEEVVCVCLGRRVGSGGGGGGERRRREGWAANIHHFKLFLAYKNVLFFENLLKQLFF